MMVQLWRFHVNEARIGCSSATLRGSGTGTTTWLGLGWWQALVAVEEPHVILIQPLSGRKQVSASF